MMAKHLFRNRLIYYVPRNPTDIKRIVDSLIGSPRDSVILPYIDSPATIGKEILQRNPYSLTICEKDKKSRDEFETYVKENHPARRIFIRDEDLVLSSYKSSLGTSSNVCASIVRENLGIQHGELNQISCDRDVKVLIPLMMKQYESSFMTHLFYQYCLKIGLCNDIFVHHYILLSNRQYKLLNAQVGGNLKLYRRISVLPNMLFKIHWLKTFDLKECFDIDLKNINERKNADPSQRQVHLAWFEPKQEFLDSMEPASFLELKFLVTQMMERRTTFVYEFLERWFDGCGLYLSTLGITNSTRTGDLSYEDYQRIFAYLRTRPNYKNSTFMHAVSSHEPWHDRFRRQLQRAVG